MTWEIVVGLTILVGSLISIMSIVVKVNGTLTRLDETVKNLQHFIEKQEAENTIVRNELNDHELRLVVLEHK